MQEQFQQRIDHLGQLLADIRRNMEHLMAENQRLKEVVRLAESELRNRRDQVQKLEERHQSMRKRQSEASRAVEQTIARLDALASRMEQPNP